MIRFLVVICILSATLITVVGWNVYAKQDALALIEGKWELDPVLGNQRKSFVCADRPLVIEIDKKALRINTRRGDKEKMGQIIWPTRNSFWVRYDDEETLGDDGHPVSWYFFLVDRNSFGQIRTDWLDENLKPTRKIAKRVRCGWL